MTQVTFTCLTVLDKVTKCEHVCCIPSLFCIYQGVIEWNGVGTVNTMVMMMALIIIIAGEFGIVYRARLNRSTPECEIVAVKTIKGKDIIS